jgi:hypothetical protein
VTERITPTETARGGMQDRGHLHMQTNEVPNVLVHYRRSAAARPTR